MARYDMRCDTCHTKVERVCAIAARESQTCDRCGATLIPLFSPPTTVVIPNAFKYSFSQLFGTTSEKDFLKEHPELVPTREAEHVEHPRDRARRKKQDADKYVADVATAIYANNPENRTPERRKRVEELRKEAGDK